MRRGTVGRSFVLASFLVTVAGAVAGPVEDSRRIDRRVAHREKAYWKGLSNRLAKATQSYLAIRRRFATRAAPDITGAFDAGRALWDECAALERERDEALIALGRRNDDAAGSGLIRVLLETATAIETTDRELFDARPIRLGYTDQVATFRREALALRERALIRAFTALERAFSPPTG